jgi:glyoxylase-like metal-dependent hydrolase (beta-lactamase superfamily II)
MAPHQLGSTMRVLRPARNVLAFYDGRIDGVRAWSEAPNWLDDGAYALGACSYAIVDGAEALVYDAHISTSHAALIRRTLEAEGVRSFRLVLSHWHADHVAGNAVFRDCEIIANVLTAELLEEHRGALEGGSPPIRPLIGPSQTFVDRLDLRVGAVPVQLHRFDIHSRDGTVLLLPDPGLLFAGDTLEDPVTYVAEPDRLGHHLADLDRLARLSFERILPNHGAPAVIEDGGYGRGLLDATRRYVEKLLRCGDDPGLAGEDLAAFMHEDLVGGHVHYFAAYEKVHRDNVGRVLAQTKRN